jgi:hypothetical protein
MSNQNLNRIIELADVMLSELPPVNNIPNGDFELVPLDFYPPKDKLDDALFSVWCVFQQLQMLKEVANEPED